METRVFVLGHSGHSETVTMDRLWVLDYLARFYNENRFLFYRDPPPGVVTGVITASGMSGMMITQTYRSSGRDFSFRYVVLLRVKLGAPRVFDNLARTHRLVRNYRPFSRIDYCVLLSL